MAESLISDSESIVNEEQNTIGGDESQSWIGCLPEELRQVVMHNGWREPADALKSYQRLEEIIGAEKSGRSLVLPENDDDAEAYDRVFKALGRPETADGYGLAEALGDVEIDRAFAGAMGQAMHQAGLSRRQALQMAAAWQEQLDKYGSTEECRYESEKEAVLNDVPPARLEAAKRGFRFTGAPLEMAERLERALGPKMAVEMFARIGECLAEDSSIAGSRSMAATATPEGASLRMGRLMADPLFSQRYLSGDKNALAEISELARRATNKY